jgi:serine protease Do
VVGLAALLGVILWGISVSGQGPASPERRDEAGVLEALQNALVHIQRMAGQAVVSIKTEGKAKHPPLSGKEAPRGELPQRGVGSGVIVDPRGFVLTNNHVVENAETIQLTLQDGRTFPGQVIGRDARTDLAVVKIDNSGDLPVAPLGDSDQVKVGHSAIAIGNPFGLGHTLTVGVISGIGRTDLGLSAFEDFIQTDAAINPGNSGGPLLNSRGEVIGINTAINPIGRGIGFAIPINMAKEVMQQLLEHGRVVRGFLGVVIQALSGDLASKFGIAADTGVLVGDILEGSPAEKAGMKRGDIIVSFAGRPVTKVRELQRLVAQMRPGAPVRLEVIRDRQEQSMSLELGELKDGEPKAEPIGARFGLTLEALTKDLARQLNVKNGEGVVISNVENGSLAARDGLRKGDIILEVERTRVSSLRAFQEAVNQLPPEENILMLILREDRSFYTVLHAPPG